MNLPDKYRPAPLIVESMPGTALILEQIFNAGNLIFLALEQLKNLSIPQSGKDDDCFARSAYFAKLHEIQRILSRCTHQLTDIEQQSIFPYTVFDSSVFADSPEDLVLEFFVQAGRLCANVYVIAPVHHQSPLHNRQKSISSTVAAAAVANISNNTQVAASNTNTTTGTAPVIGTPTQQSQSANNYFFYNGSPVEVSYSTHLEALLPSILTAMTSVEASRGQLEDLCEKIDCIQKLL